MIRMRVGFGRTARLIGILVMAGMLGIPATQPGAAQSQSNASHYARNQPLDARMERFIFVLQRGQADSLLPFFPRWGDWTYRHTVHHPAGDQVGLWRLRPKDTQAAISGPLADSFDRHRHGLAVASLMHQALHRPGRWVRIGRSRFVPPGGDASSDIFVEWRMEDGSWVISTAADEAYGAGVPLPSWCC